jgi:hypothetical protein
MVHDYHGPAVEATYGMLAAVEVARHPAPGEVAISDNSLSRAGSASAFSNGATCSAWAWVIGMADRGAQHAAALSGSRTGRDFDTHRY